MTRKATWRLSAVAALFLAGAGPASALGIYHDLTIAGWMVGNKTVQTNMGNFYAGAFTWSWDGGPVNSTSPLYCLDILHSFSGMPSTWEVQRLIAPPDPSFPPPYNTDHAAWIYYNHGTLAELSASSDPVTRTAAVQLALWEVSHDPLWNTISGDWLSTGDFRWTGSSGSAVKLQAGDILQSLYGVLDDEGRVTPPRSIYWYQPKGWPDPDRGQGQIGETPVPEPGSVALLGLGLVGAGIVAWRKRR